MNTAPTQQQSTMLPSPAKHVNYTLGMVLGVDDFIQEFAYHDGRHQAMARELIGYGTVSGLQLTIQSDARGPRIMVSPGVALSPRGQTIRVCAAQCAYLQDWLDDHRNEILQRLGSPPDDAITAHLALCYRDCTTDRVPIPGEPCRTADDMMADSRLVDDFRLELRFDAPDQHEEDAVRTFVEWLTLVPIGGGQSGIVARRVFSPRFAPRRWWSRHRRAPRSSHTARRRRRCALPPATRASSCAPPFACG
jgi:hypothetical protein